MILQPSYFHNGISYTGKIDKSLIQFSVLLGQQQVELPRLQGSFGAIMGPTWGQQGAHLGRGRCWPHELHYQKAVCTTFYIPDAASASLMPPLISAANIKDDAKALMGQ